MCQQFLKRPDCSSWRLDPDVQHRYPPAEVLCLSPCAFLPFASIVFNFQLGICTWRAPGICNRSAPVQQRRGVGVRCSRRKPGWLQDWLFLILEACETPPLAVVCASGYRGYMLLPNRQRWSSLCCGMCWRQHAKVSCHWSLIRKGMSLHFGDLRYRAYPYRVSRPPSHNSAPKSCEGSLGVHRLRDEGQTFPCRVGKAL